MAFAVLALPFGLAFATDLPDTLATFAIFGALLAPLLCRSRRPRLSSYACVAAVIAFTLLSPVMSVHVLLLVAISAHTAASRLPRIELGAVCAVLVATTMVNLLTHASSSSVTFSAGAAMVTMALSLMSGLLTLRDRQRKLDAERYRSLEVRAGVARELHDIVAHSLGVIAAQAEGARYASENDPAIAYKSLGNISEISRQSLRRIRVMVATLRSADEDSILGEPEGFSQIPIRVREMDRSGVAVSAALPERWPSADIRVQTVANRVVAEGLANAVRHGSGGIELSVAQKDTVLCIEVCNRAIEATRTDPGMGLAGLAERISSVGGTLSSGPCEEGKVWRLKAEIPL